jgi:hypothetical protein
MSRASWELGYNRVAAKPPGRRIIERLVGSAKVPYPRKVYAAEWDDPRKSGSVTRHWFGSRAEAEEALRRGPETPDDHRARPSVRESWRLR